MSAGWGLCINNEFPVWLVLIFFAFVLTLLKHSIGFMFNVYKATIAGAIILKYDFLNEISVPTHFTADTEVIANKHFP